MLEGMIYGLPDGGKLPAAPAPQAGSWQQWVEGATSSPCEWMGLPRVSNSGRRQHCKEHCRDTRPGRKPLEVCQTKVGNSKANPHLPTKLAANARQQGHWPERQGGQRSRESLSCFPAPADSLGAFYSLHLKKKKTTQHPNAKIFSLNQVSQPRCQAQRNRLSLQCFPACACCTKEWRAKGLQN